MPGAPACLQFPRNPWHPHPSLYLVLGVHYALPPPPPLPYLAMSSSPLSAYVCVCTAALLCPTLRDPMDCSLLGSSVHGSPFKHHFLHDAFSWLLRLTWVTLVYVLFHLILLLCDITIMKQWETWFWGAPKSLHMVTAAMKLKDACSLEEELWPT